MWKQPGKREQGGFVPEVNPAVQSPVGEKPWNVASARTSDAVLAVCEVNGKQVTALVDTGAAVTLIHRDIFDKARNANTRTLAATRVIVGANNSPLSVHLVAELDIKLSGIVVKHEVQVCDDLSQDMLVGTDLLKPNKVIDFATGTLEAKGERDNLVYKSSKEIRIFNPQAKPQRISSREYHWTTMPIVG